MKSGHIFNTVLTQNPKELCPYKGIKHYCSVLIIPA